MYQLSSQRGVSVRTYNGGLRRQVHLGDHCAKRPRRLHLPIDVLHHLLSLATSGRQCPHSSQHIRRLSRRDDMQSQQFPVNSKICYLLCLYSTCCLCSRLFVSLNKVTFLFRHHNSLCAFQICICLYGFHIDFFCIVTEHVGHFNEIV